MATQTNEARSDILTSLEGLSSPLDPAAPSTAIILAAGHGKRIRSETAKTLHEIWGRPTVVREAEAARLGLGPGSNLVIVVGIQALEVARAAGRREGRAFAYQAEQIGTGDAVRVGLNVFPNGDYRGNIYIFPGDMGLLTAAAVSRFREQFESQDTDMMVLTGIYDGAPADNFYGRIVRVPERDASGQPLEDAGQVIEIKECKDILRLSDDAPYEVEHRGRVHRFSRQELIEIREFNTSVYAFKGPLLKAHIDELTAENAQGEIYFTDLIHLFNQHGLVVRDAQAVDNDVVLAFNVKSELKQMQAIARRQVYERLKDIVTLQDEEDFYVADEVVAQIEEMDREGVPLDIFIGQGAWVGPGVRLSRGVHVGHRSVLGGNILLGRGVQIRENVSLSTYAHQTLKVGDFSEILEGNIIKGNLEIGSNTRIESRVNVTGSDEHPTRIGNCVTIKGTSYLFGSIVEDDLLIEHSVLIRKRAERVVKKDGSIQPIRYVLPQPDGLDSIQNL
ncbi:MAG: multidrug transporter [Candidatus Latescibacteria bacterium]|nr:multidrug transporter [Candidatus Latescibacterota bacterium]